MRMHTLKLASVLVLIALLIVSTSYSEERDSRWEKVRLHHLVLEPECQWCGNTDIHDLQVHHIREFSKNKKYELLDSEDGKSGNLITLCNKCHLIVGHNRDFHDDNPYVREECELHKLHLKKYDAKRKQLEIRFDALLAGAN